MDFMAPPSEAPPEDFFTAPMTTFTDEPEDEDEWEYEYSHTDTESFFVTLDLTTPHVPPKRRARKPPDRRAGKWTNPGLGKQKRHTLPAPPTFKAPTPGEQETATPEQGQDPEIEGDEPFQDEDEEEEDEQPTGENDGGAPPPQRPTKVQILDLHSRNPIVSYDGHVYSCQWAENIGTELLFKGHDKKDNSLPGIRTLPGNVDLIAVSSARIVSQSVQLKPNPNVIPRNRKRMHGRIRGLKIPVGTGASAKRKQQAAFLERLMDVKEKKGEEDLVTVLTKAKPGSVKWLEVLREKREKERQKLNLVIANGDPNDKEVLYAQNRLLEIDDEEERRNIGLEARGLLADGKRKAKEDDARKRVKTNDRAAPPKTRRGPGKRRPRKVPLNKMLGRELDDLQEDSVGIESTIDNSTRADSEMAEMLSADEDMASPGTGIGDMDEDGAGGEEGGDDDEEEEGQEGEEDEEMYYDE